MGTPAERPPPETHGIPTGRHGTVKLGNRESNPEFYGFADRPFVPPSPPRLGGFVYLAFHRWMLEYKYNQRQEI